MGNFRTAWISHEWARKLGLPWVVRFEDIDAPRVVPGARSRQLAELAELGLNADELVLQSDRAGRHWQVFEKAVQEKRVYPCFCSRKEVREALEGAASAPHGTPPIYSGRCRDLTSRPQTSLPTLAWRFRSDDPTGAGDFIVARTGPSLEPDAASFVPAYNWACAIDDFDGGYQLLVRAHDLADVAEQQRAIGRLLASWQGKSQWRAPAIFHCALIVGDDGHRLEKRTQGVTLPELKSRGLGPAVLVARFRASYHEPRAAFEPGAIFGEERTTMRLSEVLGS